MRIITAANQKDFYDRYSDPTDRQTVWIREASFVSKDDSRVAPLAEYTDGFPSGCVPISGGTFLNEIDNVSYDHRIFKQGELKWELHNHEERFGNFEKWHYLPMVTLVAGKLYRGILYTETRTPPFSRLSLTRDTQYRDKAYWSADDFLSDHTTKSGFELKAAKKKRESVERWFNPQQRDFSPVHQGVNSPVLVWGKTWSAKDGRWRSGWIVNGLLKSLDFMLTMNPHTLAQELDMYLGGVLTKREPMEPVSDKLKLQAHGMDQSSFRKGPTKVHT